MNPGVWMCAHPTKARVTGLAGPVVAAAAKAPGSAAMIATPPAALMKPRRSRAGEKRISFCIRGNLIEARTPIRVNGPCHPRRPRRAGCGNPPVQFDEWWGVPGENCQLRSVNLYPRTPCLPYNTTAPPASCPKLTCEAVLAELCFLIADVPKGIVSVRDNFASGAWAMDSSLKAERERVFALMCAYSDQPMSPADGCLVRMSELRADSRIFTLDRHFQVYRRNRRQVIPLITPLEA